MTEIRRSKKLVGDAKSQARRLPRPPKIPRRCWGDCQDLLVELAAHVPNIWPAQGPSKRTKKGESLVERTGQPLITVRRNLKRLEEAGLIVRTVRDYGDRWNGTEYSLPWWKPLSDTQVSPRVARPLPLTLSGSCRSDGAVAAAQNELPTMSSPSEKKERCASSFGGSNNNSGAAADADARREDQPPSNKRPGPCVVCGEWVAIGEAVQPGLQDWLEPVHLRCYGKAPGSVDPWWEREVERADRERLAQEAEAEIRRGRIATAKAEPTEEHLEELTLPELKEVAAAIGISLPPRTRARDYIEAIVEATV